MYLLRYNKRTRTHTFNVFRHCLEQRLNVEVPLNADELEKVFDTLDTDRNGYLTLDEFSSGFSTSPRCPPSAQTPRFGVPGAKLLIPQPVVPLGEFLCSQRSPATEEEARRPRRGRSEAMSQSRWETKLAAGEDEEEKHFCALMENLGAGNVFEE